MAIGDIRRVLTGFARSRSKGCSDKKAGQQEGQDTCPASLWTKERLEADRRAKAAEGIRIAVEKLEAGDLTGIRMAYEAFATEDQGLIRQAGEAIRGQLSPLTGTRLCKLCERFSSFTSLDWAIDWAGISPERLEKELEGEAYRYVLILGSFHPNGYFREKCVYAMADLSGMLPWLFLRANDWVIQVRDRACKVLERYLASCEGTELIEALPALDRLRGCRRRTEGQMQRLEEQVRERLSQTLKTMDLKAVAFMEPAVRASLYRMATGYGAWTMEQMETCLAQERQSCLKRILIRRILVHPDCTPGWAEHYLKDPSAQVRRIAVEFRYGHLKSSWTGLEEMLLDSSKGIRGYAAYILEKHGDLDIRQYYLDYLGAEAGAAVCREQRTEEQVETALCRPQDAERSSAQAACVRKYVNAVLGLSECSRRRNVPVFLSCLEMQERRIVRAALQALGTQEDFSDGELLWRYLADERCEIAKAAYLSIRRQDFHPGAERLYHAYVGAGAEHQKRYLLNLLLRESSWERLPYLLRLYRQDMTEQEKLQVLAGIRCRSMYGKVTETLRGKILAALEEKRDVLPDGVEKGILYDMKFVAR